MLTVLSLPPLLPLVGWPPAVAQWVFGSTTGVVVWVAVVLASWYLILFSAYVLFSRALYNRRVNDLFTYTNPTHLYRRHRDPETRLKQIGVYKKAPGARRADPG